MEEAELSPEELARRLEISNMTVRRWMKKPLGEEMPVLYEKALRDAIYQLVVEELLPTGSKSFQLAVKIGQRASFEAVIKGLGFNTAPQDKPGFAPDRLLAGLSQIGAQESQQAEVQLNRKKILNFSRMGAEWKERITPLLRVIRSQRLSRVDKLVAYGALFYLICPLDLIPDNVPVFGLMDDFCVLGFAAEHYVKKHKLLLG